jgi:hypothetical protein
VIKYGAADDEKFEAEPVALVVRILVDIIVGTKHAEDVVYRTARKTQHSTHFAEPKPPGVLGEKVYNSESFFEGAKFHKILYYEI